MSKFYTFISSKNGDPVMYLKEVFYSNGELQFVYVDLFGNTYIHSKKLSKSHKDCLSLYGL